MRVAYLGTPEFAVAALDALSGAGHTIVAVVAQPDRPAGRGQAIQKPPTKVWAENHEVRVYQPERVRDGVLAASLTPLKPDVLAVAAYGRILGKDLLGLAPFGSLNVHASLLPRWRGAAPIQWSIASGDLETGVTIMQMDEGLDTGDILLQRVEKIRPEDDFGSLGSRLSLLGGASLVEALALLERRAIVPVPQEATNATHAPLLTRDDGRVDFTRNAEEIANRLRGFSPWPGTYTVAHGKMLKILEARPSPLGELPKDGAPGFALSIPGSGLLVACGGGTALLISRVQPQDNRPMGAFDFVNGLRLRSLKLGA